MNPGTVLEDRYELVEQIGQGGMAIVYRARGLAQLATLRRSAIGGRSSRTTRKALERFRREALAASR